jgi:hypothetical protein
MLQGERGGAVGWGTALRKVAGSIPNGVTEIFHWFNPSGTEMSTKNIPWGVKTTGE